MGTSEKDGWSQVAVRKSTIEEMKKLKKIINEENPFVNSMNDIVLYLIRYYQENNRKK